MSEKKTTTLVVIPYAPGKAQGWELKTSVHGWRKYFQGDAHIVTIGERSEMVDILLGEGALSEHIERPVPSVYPFERPRELEFAAIARFIIERFGKEYSGFVKTDDDIYPINPFTLADVKRPKWVNNELTGDADDPNHFRRAMYNTRQALAAAGLPVLNYSSHCPRWYDMAKLAAMLDRFDCDNVPHLHESLYYNTYFKAGAAKADVSKDGNLYKYGVYGEFDAADLEKAWRAGCRWVNNTVESYDIDIIKTIERLAL